MTIIAMPLVYQPMASSYPPSAYAALPRVLQSVASTGVSAIAFSAAARPCASIWLLGSNANPERKASAASAWRSISVSAAPAR